MMGSSQLIKKLNLLGLTDKKAQIYLCLLKSGILSPLELSRITEIKRATVYRILEDLKQANLVEEIIDKNTTKAKAIDPEQLELIIAQQESEIKKKQSILPELITQLSSLRDNPSSSTQIKYFKGRKGLQQLLWNTLKSKNGFVGYGYGDWNKGVGKTFADKLREERVKRNVYSREIQNPKQGAGKLDFTKVKGYFDVYRLSVIPKSVVEINHDTYIYNDVFAFYHYYQGEQFGVEINNPEIAKTQRQMFEVLWKQAKKIG